jgi:hypothetical protein
MMKPTMSRALRMMQQMTPYNSRHAAAAFMREFDRAAQRGDLHACEHGHVECSTMPRGPCFDEVLSNFPDIDGSD